MKEEREKEKNLHVQLQAAFDGNVQASGQLLSTTLLRVEGALFQVDPTFE